MPKASHEPIAIVGSACRFAGGTSSPAELWDVLQQPQDLRQTIPEDRFNPTGYYHPDGSYHGRSNVSHAYFLEDVTAFDAEFFGVKPAEAKVMDPQQRLLMEVAYEGLENAGMAIENLKGSDTGVYVGSMFHDYDVMLLRDLSDLPMYSATGTGRSILSNRISYFFDWRGPSITLDTACSSSMVAVHLAIEALRSGDCRMALACGSNVILSPEPFILESKLKMLSPNGRCRMWDEGADGYARGEGVGVLVLKTLSAALADGDSIESVIRETGLNQDGASGYKGITMPNAEAQRALIRSTYAKAGLNLDEPGHNPQFFEAHGTGTPAGDPTEAEAIFRAFSSKANVTPLYTGSIKTVLGHTEGTAGIAAIMKASLSLKHAIIPPNMWFENLSPRVEPFYKGVVIPTTSQKWPCLARSERVRRASVNSFGFGGTNSHAILESYDDVDSSRIGESCGPFAPFVFSAGSEKSLRDTISAYTMFLQRQGAATNHRDLCWTLSKRRSTLPYRASFPASSIEDLRSNMTTKLAEESVGKKALATTKTGKVLGVFTGQGAQYPRMGAELIEQSAEAAAIIERLEESLRELPDGPEWSLKNELLADESCSRVHDASISQPLCTAIQILQVDLIRHAGVKFDAVVGHSSGEIAAAYAAGYLTAKDAIRVAYYRGVHLRHAVSPNDAACEGAMVAVNNTAEDMEELCCDPVFAGRISIAAYNSPSTLTVSGDEESITELQTLLDDEGKFNRRLRVNKAYHSNHMLPCAAPYQDSLVRCGIHFQGLSSSADWISSVYGTPVDSSTDLEVNYWVKNLTHPVLFSQAIEYTLKASDQQYDLVLEIGPTAVLRKPTTETTQSVLNKQLPYTGLFKRGVSAVEATSAALGFLWINLEAGRVDLNRYEQTLSQHKNRCSVVKGLPSYSWDHSVKHWHESRTSRAMRRRSNRAHDLLGDLTADSAVHHMSWKHLLKFSEMEWLHGHQVEGQIVFPAAGYLATAIEAARHLASSEKREARLIEVTDFSIHQPIILDQDKGVESLIQLVDIKVDEITGRIYAKFTYSAALLSNPDVLTLAASGEVTIIGGQPSQSLLRVRKRPTPHMIEVDTARFYESLSRLGYQFSGRFQSLNNLKRRHLKSTCSIIMQHEENSLVHPAELDAVLQSCLVAYSYPGDEKLRRLYLPTTIDRVRVNPAILNCDSKITMSQEFHIDTSIHPSENVNREIFGDISMSPSHGTHEAIQIQGAKFHPLGGATEDDDRKLFSQERWIPSYGNSVAISQAIPLTEEHERIIQLLERTAIFYLRSFDKMVAEDDPTRRQFPTNRYLSFARHIATEVEAGAKKRFKREWLHDTLDDVHEATKAYRDLVQFQIMELVGSQMPRVFEGKTTMLEEFRQVDGILDRYYADGISLKESAQWASLAIRQIVDINPHMNIMEIGAGTGGATKAILREVGDDFRSYTYTDVSAAFFQESSQVFSKYSDKMIFKTYDAEKAPSEQGYAEGTYDLVVAFFVIHATSDISKTLRNIRKLLRPGGFIVVGECCVLDDALASSGFIFGTLPGWWLGKDKEGRELFPFLSPTGWNEVLHQTGFSGPDICVPDTWKDTLNAYSFVSQAVDEQIQFLREPLASAQWRPPVIEDLVIVGAQSKETLKIAERMESTLNECYASNVRALRCLEDLAADDQVNANTTIISLTELDEPIFKDMSPTTFSALKKVFGTGKRVFWLTKRRMKDNPFCNMTVGFGRVAMNESPDLRLKQVDVQDPDTIQVDMIAEIFLRFYASEFLGTNVLWTSEPEIIVKNDLQQLIPRMRHLPQLNDRHNSAQRVLLCNKSPHHVPVALNTSPRGMFVREVSNWEISASENLSQSDSVLELHVSQAIFPAIRTRAGYQYLVLGKQLGVSDSFFLALTASLCSIMRLPSKSAVSLSIHHGLEEHTLSTAAAHLIALTVFESMHMGQTVVLHNATNVVRSAFSTQAAARKIETYLTCDATDIQQSLKDASCMSVPEFATSTDIADMLPTEPAVFVGLDVPQYSATGNEHSILSYLRDTQCRVETARTLLSTSAASSKQTTFPSALGETLKQAIQFMQEDLGFKEARPSPSLATTSLADLANGTIPKGPLSIVNFLWETPIPVQMTRLDAQPMFKGMNSTYWIAGMAGDLGLSLCDWMISKGARHIVISSRRPNVSPEYIAAHERRGATVEVIPCDLTIESEVQRVHQIIKKTLPPVAGVVNGAMVLRDVFIRDMTFEQLLDVLGPKVQGSIHLDRAFYDENLDFFVLVASVGSVVGSRGQANYAAANQFLSGLSAQRRARGLRASTLNAGGIIGAGYITRDSRQLDFMMELQKLMKISEEDWHQSICEAMEAGRLESNMGHELTIGISSVHADIAKPPPWMAIPKLTEFITYSAANKSDVLEETPVESLQDILARCSTRQQVLEAVQRAFSSQLRAMLQINMSDEDIMAARSSEIGLDSLVSVDIRSWFLKSLKVNVPVLRILGNDAMSSIAEYAIERLPALLTPLIENAPNDVSKEVGPSFTSERINGSDPVDLNSNSPAEITPPTTASSQTDSLLNGHQSSASASTASQNQNALTNGHHKNHTNNHMNGTARVDWEKESETPANWNSIEALAGQPPRSPPSVVVLTGATGLLGQHLLSHLLKIPSVKRVHCLAVRGLDDRLKRDGLSTDPRIQYHGGNLSDRFLGLSPEDAQSIFDTVDAVIHNAADTSHVKVYSEVRTPNVESTKDLISLSLPRRIPFHYISSAGVALYYNKPSFPPVSVGGQTSLYPAADGTFGYGASKWVNERLLERTHSKFGLPVSIYRPSTIIREGRDAEVPQAQLDWVNMLMKYIRKTKKVPQLGQGRGSLDLVKMETCCTDVIGQLVNTPHDNNQGVRYSNQVGDVHIDMDHMETMDTAMGERYDLLPLHGWVGEAMAAGLHPGIAMLIEEMHGPGKPSFPKLLRKNPNYPDEGTRSV